MFEQLPNINLSSMWFNHSFETLNSGRLIRTGLSMSHLRHQSDFWFIVSKQVLKIMWSICLTTLNREFTWSEANRCRWHISTRMWGLRHDFVIFTLVFLSVFVSQTRCYLIDVTGAAFGGQSDGFLAAFGDFNSDKKTDLFVITGNGMFYDSCQFVG